LSHGDCPEIALALLLMKALGSLSNPKLRYVAMKTTIYDGFAFVCLLRYSKLIVLNPTKAFHLTFPSPYLYIQVFRTVQ
jgi:hypothetical protein